VGAGGKSAIGSSAHLKIEPPRPLDHPMTRWSDGPILRVGHARELPAGHRGPWTWNRALRCVPNWARW